MIYSLEIENFHSILEPTHIDLRAFDNAPDNIRLAAIYPDSKERVPKVVSILGANASGKTTVLRALSFLIWFSRDSFQLPPDSPLPFEYFRSEIGRERPTRLAIVFGGRTELNGTSVVEPENYAGGYGDYRYEVEITHRNVGPSFVSRETLFHRPSGARRIHRIFDRMADVAVKGSAGFAVDTAQEKAVLRRWNASAISFFAQFGHPQATALQEMGRSVTWNVLFLKQEMSDVQLGHILGASPSLVDQLNRFIRAADLGIKSVSIRSEGGGLNLYFDHVGLTTPVPWQLESRGTQSFIRHYPMIKHALDNGGVAIIDELDASLHPMMLAEICDWFQDPEVNLRDAQLWFSCQNASLLEQLSKEEILFCSKDHEGKTAVYGLKDVKNVRRVDNYYRKYLSGMYGAIPNIG